MDHWPGVTKIETDPKIPKKRLKSELDWDAGRKKVPVRVWDWDHLGFDGVGAVGKENKISEQGMVVKILSLDSTKSRCR